MEKKRRVVSFRITPTQDRALSSMLAKTGDNRNKYFQKLVQKVLAEEIETKPN